MREEKIIDNVQIIKMHDKELMINPAMKYLKC